MVSILYPPQVVDLKSENQWPEAFEEDAKEESKDFTRYRTPRTLKSDSESSSGDSLEANVNQLNRPVVFLSESDESSDDAD